MIENIAILAVFFISSIFHILIGFGFPLLSTPILFTITSPQNAIVLTILPTMFINFFSIFSIKKGFHVLKQYYMLGIFVMIGSFIGTRILIIFPSNIYKLLLAFIIIFYLSKDKLKLNFSNFIQNNKTLALIIFGLIGGIIGGMVNIMLVIIAMFVLELNLDKSESIVIMNFCFLLGKSTQAAIFFNANALGAFEFYFGLITILVCIIAIFIANKFKNKINDLIFKKILKITLIIFAIILFIQYFLSF